MWLRCARAAPDQVPSSAAFVVVSVVALAVDVDVDVGEDVVAFVYHNVADCCNELSPLENEDNATDDDVDNSADASGGSFQEAAKIADADVDADTNASEFGQAVSVAVVVVVADNDGHHCFVDISPYIDGVADNFVGHYKDNLRANANGDD